MSGTASPPRVDTSGRVDFRGGGPFSAKLRLRGRLLLQEPGRARRAQARTYAKSAVMAAWVAASCAQEER